MAQRTLVLVELSVRSPEDAIEVAYEIANFEVDERYEPVHMAIGTYVVSGIATGEIKHPLVVSVNTSSKLGR
jgi:hypothetical protein